MTIDQEKPMESLMDNYWITNYGNFCLGDHPMNHMWLVSAAVM